MGDANELSELKAKVDPAALKDYLDRRTFNGNFNIRTLDLVEDGTIDFLIIPQDDSAKYGYTAMDQKTVRAKIDEKVLNDRVILYRAPMSSAWCLSPAPSTRLRITPHAYTSSMRPRWRRS